MGESAMLTGQSETEVTNSVRGLSWCDKEDDDDQKLMSFAMLSRELKQRGIIDRSRKVIYIWSTKGCKRIDTDGVESRERVRLRTVRVGRSKLSTLRWVKEFLVAFGGTDFNP